MNDTSRHRITAYVHIDDLIVSVCKAVSDMKPHEVGVWYAERLELAAKMIREKNAMVQDLSGKP